MRQLPMTTDAPPQSRARMLLMVLAPIHPRASRLGFGYALSAALIAAASIGLAAAMLGGAYLYALSVSEAPAGAVLDRVPEIAAAVGEASAGGSRTVYGIYAKELRPAVDPLNVTLVLPGSAHTFAFNKSVILVYGTSAPAVPGRNFTSEPSARAVGGSQEGRAVFAIVLTPSVQWIKTEAELGAGAHLVVLRVPIVANDFSASGMFSLALSWNGEDRVVKELAAKEGGKAEVYIDGGKAAEFTVGGGDRVRLAVEYELIRAGIVK